MKQLDLSLIQEISNNLDNFSKTGNSFNFRCPYCGDSSNKRKARGYFFEGKDNNTFYKCHNCSVSKTLLNFCKDNFPHILKSYQLSKYSGNKKNNETSLNKESPLSLVNFFDGINTIDKLNTNHIAWKYLVDRKVPFYRFKDIYYVEDFKTLVNSFKNVFSDTNVISGLIFPLIYKNSLYGIQFRNLDINAKTRYYTLYFKPGLRVYNFDNINPKKTVYVTEGIFDSMYGENFIAMLGSELPIEFLSSNNVKEYVFIFDNEPNNKQIVSKMKNVIDKGYGIFIWNENLKCKDLNDAMKMGINIDIEKHIFYGVSAILRLNKWVKNASC